MERQYDDFKIAKMTMMPCHPRAKVEPIIQSRLQSARLQPRILDPQKPAVDRWANTDLDLRTEFAPQPFRGVVDKQADLGREVPAFRMYDMNGCGWGFVFDENGLQ